MGSLKRLAMFLAPLALILAAPTLAAASTGLTQGGTLVPVGQSVKLTSSNWRVANTKFGTLGCDQVESGFNVTKNNATEGVEGESSILGTGTGCRLGGSAFTMKEVVFSAFKSAAGTPGQGTTNLKFVWVWPGSVVCTFTGTNVPFTYTSGTSNIGISSASLEASPQSCVSTTPKLTATLALSRAGQSVLIQ